MSVLLVASGKGGVGKSVVSCLLAATLAERGHRVLLADADQNMGDLHVLLGAHPLGHQAELLSGTRNASELVQAVGQRLWLLPGDSGSEHLYAIGETDRARLYWRLTEAFRGFDMVVVDAGSGLESAVRVAAMRADRLVVVTTPEPPALTDAYALVKLATLRAPELPVEVLVNRALDGEDGRLAYEKLALAAERFLRRGLRYLGALPEDASVRRAVRDPQRFLADLCRSEAARSVRSEVLDRMDLAQPARSVA